MQSITRIAMAVSIVLGVACRVEGASVEPCQADAPYVTTAGSLDVGRPGMPISFIVAARDKAPNCPGDQLRITAAGLPPGAVFRPSNPAPGEVVAMITLANATPGTYNVTYVATDVPANNTTSFSLPLTIGVRENTAPTLDPISDLTILRYGLPVTFTVTVNDVDQDLAISQSTLVVDGLPAGARKTYTQLTPWTIGCKITIDSRSAEIGTYRVNIRAKDSRGGLAISQMRLNVVP